MRVKILHEISVFSQACKNTLILSNIIFLLCAQWDTASLAFKWDWETLYWVGWKIINKKAKNSSTWTQRNRSGNWLFKEPALCKWWVLAQRWLAAPETTGIKEIQDNLIPFQCYRNQKEKETSIQINKSLPNSNYWLFILMVKFQFRYPWFRRIQKVYRHFIE